MSSARPENGLPERRPITADSFRALKLKLAGGDPKAAVPAGPSSPPPVASTAIPLPPPPDLLMDVIETLPELAEPDPLLLPESLAVLDGEPPADGASEFESPAAL